MNNRRKVARSRGLGDDSLLFGARRELGLGTATLRT
jgi:hypothetical protein